MSRNSSPAVRITWSGRWRSAKPLWTSLESSLQIRPPMRAPSIERCGVPVRRASVKWNLPFRNGDRTVGNPMPPNYVSHAAGTVRVAKLPKRTSTPVSCCFDDSKHHGRAARNLDMGRFNSVTRPTHARRPGRLNHLHPLRPLDSRASFGISNNGNLRQAPSVGMITLCDD